MQDLLKRLKEKHGKCAEALTKKAAVDAQAAVVAHTPNVMQAMMLLQQARFRAKAAQDRAKAIRPDHHWLCEFGDAGNDTSCEKQFNLDHHRPDHHWLCEFGDAGNGTSCVKQFNLDHRKREDYRGTRFYNKECALVIKRWLNRVEEDPSGLTFQEWTPDVDTSQTPLTMLINSIDLRAAGFKLKEVL